MAFTLRIESGSHPLLREGCALMRIEVQTT